MINLTARDITIIINKEHLENVILVAHSKGGEIALEVAIASPQKIIGIIGIDNLKNVSFSITEEGKIGMQPYIKKFIANYQGMAEGMAKAFTVSKDSAVIQRMVNRY